MTVEIILLLVLLLLNFITTGFEVAYVTLSFPDIYKLTRRRFYIRNPEGVLFSILAYSNLFQIAFAVLMLKVLARFMDAQYAAFVSALLSATILLIVSEYLPKYIARSRPHLFFELFEPLVSLFYYTLLPLNALFYRLFRRNPDKFIQDYIDELKNKGYVDEREARILRGAMSFFRRQADILIEPFESYSILNASDTLKDIRENPPENYEVLVKDGSGKFSGFIYRKDILKMDENDTVEDIKRPYVYVPATSRIFHVVRLMKSHEVSLVFTDMGVITVESFWRGFVRHSLEEKRDL